MNAHDLARAQKALVTIMNSGPEIIGMHWGGIQLKDEEIYWLYANIPHVETQPYTTGEFKHFGILDGVQFFLVSDRESYPGLRDLQEKINGQPI